MANFMKKHLLSMLLTIIAFVVIVEAILHIYYGYYSSVNVLVILFMGLLTFVRYILIVICLAVTIFSIAKHQHKVFFTLLWIFIAILGQIPKEHFETFGALFSLYNNNPNQVRDEARILIDEYTPMTCIGYQTQRFPCDNPIPRDNLPSSIRRVHIRNVLVFDDYIIIEKFGLEGVFRGFIVFRRGSDLWANEKAITRVNGCNTCWKIRIIDGLYWYHASPSDPPIFMSSLK